MQLQHKTKLAMRITSSTTIYDKILEGENFAITTSIHQSNFTFSVAMLTEKQTIIILYAHRKKWLKSQKLWKFSSLSVFPYTIFISY